MDKNDIAQRVNKVVSRILRVDAAKLRPEHSFATDLKAESIQSIELVAGFEAEFGLDMDEDEALSVATVGGAVEYIAQCLAKK